MDENETTAESIIERKKSFFDSKKLTRLIGGENLDKFQLEMMKIEVLGGFEVRWKIEKKNYFFLAKIGKKIEKMKK